MIDFQKILIKKKSTILQALNAIDAGVCKTAFVVDDQNRLLGSLTDGDIRRALIIGVALDDPIENFIKTDPVFLNGRYSIKKAKSIMERHLWGALPVVNDQKIIIDVIRLKDLIDSNTQDIPVIIMAGGLGKRLGELVSDVPKPMLKVAGEPILFHIISHLKKYDFTNIYISVNYKSDVIEDYFGNGDNFDCSIKYIKEPKHLGTGGSIRLCDGITDKPFIVLNGDVLTTTNIKNMLDFHIQNKFDMTIGTVNHKFNIDFGVLEIENSIVKKIQEKPALDYKINGGIYCLSPNALQHIPVDEYFEITELVTKDITAGSFLIEDYWIDVGHVSQFETAQKEFSQIIGK